MKFIRKCAHTYNRCVASGREQNVKAADYIARVAERILKRPAEQLLEPERLAVAQFMRFLTSNRRS